MNNLIENNYVKELKCGANFSYILNDNSTFLSTEYKVLQSQDNSCFVKCFKMMHNGKTQLYYMTTGLKSFSSMLPSLNAEKFLAIVTNLLSSIVEVKQNGFLSCLNVDIGFDHIFVDPTTDEVKLLYLPLSQRFFDDNSRFERELLSGLVKIILDISSLSSPKTIQLSEELSNGALSIEEVCARVKDTKFESGVHTSAEQSGRDEKSANTVLLKITAINAPKNVEIVVTKDEFVIGKNPELCDGIVDFNMMISRSHCQINKKDNGYTITDLQSTNGTYINKMRLRPGLPYTINSGDTIRLADSDFVASIDKEG